MSPIPTPHDGSFAGAAVRGDPERKSNLRLYNPHHRFGGLVGLMMLMLLIWGSRVLSGGLFVFDTLNPEVGPDPVLSGFDLLRAPFKPGPKPAKGRP